MRRIEWRPGECVTVGVATVAFVLAAASAWGCNHDRTGEGWQVSPGNDAVDDTGIPEDTVVRDTGRGPDTAPEDTREMDAGEWSGWYRNGSDEKYFVPGATATAVTGGASSVTALCQVQFQPSEPKWTVEPSVDRRDLWRLRQPPATRGPGTRPSLSSDGIGYVAFEGERRGRGGADVFASATTVKPCETLQRLGRCAVPHAGDLCAEGVSPLAPDMEPQVTLETNATTKEPAATPFDFTFEIEFAPVTDNSRRVRVDLTVPRYGPADGLQVDWRLREASDAVIRKSCSAWGAGVTVEYSVDEAGGWLRWLRSRSRNGDTSAAVLNMSTGEGKVVGGDDSDTPVECSTEPIELWVGQSFQER